VLGIAGMAAVKRKESYHGVYHRRLAARRNRQRVLVAVSRKLATTIWHILHHMVEHYDLGAADYFAKHHPERAIKRMIRQANARYDGMLRSHPSRRIDKGDPRSDTHAVVSGQKSGSPGR
jgi:hypothetical protein